MKIVRSGDVLNLQNVTDVYNTLPVGIYLLKFDPREGYYLEKKSDFVLPEKLYGDHSIVDRWLTSYRSYIKNLGIILSGLKGTGKTITAQKLCIDSGLPVILISDAYAGSDFVSFMSSSVFNESIIFIDEYEKIYNTNSRIPATDFLSLMDGNFKSHKIFLLTVNDFNIDSFLINRPSRIKYRKSYESLDRDVVESVINDLLDNKEHSDSIFEFFGKLEICTFDLLVTLINEMNLFNEDAISCAKHLNLESSKNFYVVSEVIGDKKFECGTVNLSLMDSSFFVSRSYMYSHGDLAWDKVLKIYDNRLYDVNIPLDDATITKDKDMNLLISYKDYNFVLEKSKTKLLF